MLVAASDEASLQKDAPSASRVRRRAPQLHIHLDKEPVLVLSRVGKQVIMAALQPHANLATRRLADFKMRRGRRIARQFATGNLVGHSHPKNVVRVERDGLRVCVCTRALRTARIPSMAAA